MYLDSSPNERLLGNKQEQGSQFWIPDKSAKECCSCQKAFNFFNRKHHCRICGHIFCSNCSFTREVEPLGPKHRKEVIRVCEYCNGTLNDYITRVKQSAVLIKPTTSLNGSLSELEGTPTFSRKLTRFNNPPATSKLSQIHAATECEDNGEQDEIRSVRSRIENPSILEGALMLGEIEEEDEPPMEIDDFLKNGQRQGTPFEKAIASSQHIDPDSACTLFDFAEHHIRQAVRQQAAKAGVSDQWLPLLVDFTVQAVENVKSSSRLLNDSMDFSKFVRIKRLQWHDASRSRYIHGIMATKNVADRRMPTKIQNPRILLISSPLQFFSRPRNNYAAIDSLIQQESYYLAILLRKIQLLLPDIIVTESSASRSVLDALRKQGVTVITNVKPSVMASLARCTQTIVLPSTDLIDTGVVLGTCNKFYVANLSRPSGRSTISIDQQDIVKIDRSQIVFEGCNPILGCTMVISGPDLDELSRIKGVLKNSLTIARNIVLERGYLLQCGIELPEKESPFLGKHFYLLSQEKILLSSYRMVIGQARQTNHNTDTSEYILPQKPAGSGIFQTSQADMSESKIKEQLDKICGKQKMERLYFYSGSDRPLGSYITDKISSATQMCKTCKRSNHLHYQCIYMLGGRLKISVSVLKASTTEQPEKKKTAVSTYGPKPRFTLPIGPQGRFISKEGRITQTAMQIGQAQHDASFRQPIMTYNFCKICRRRVTPKEHMDNEYYEYSLSCFLLQHFINTRVVVRSRQEADTPRPCGHSGYRAIIRVFKQGATFLKMDFQPKLKYSFQPLYLLPKLQPSSPSEDPQMIDIDGLITYATVIYGRYTDHIKQKLINEVAEGSRRARQPLTHESLYLKESQIMVMQKLADIAKQLEERIEVVLAKIQEVKKYAQKHPLQRVLLSHSLKYHVFLGLRKFKVILRYLILAYLNVLYYCFSAKQTVGRALHGDDMWPSESVIIETETVADLFDAETFQLENAPFSSLALGSNGCFLQVSPRNWGSFVSSVLISDVYREVLASQNYFSLQQEVQNFPSSIQASFKGNVVLSVEKKKLQPSNTSSISHHVATPDIQIEDQNILSPGTVKTWWLRQGPAKELPDQRKRPLPCSFDVFNGQSVNKSLVEDQLLKDTRVHMTFAFQCDGKVLDVKINRDGVVKHPLFRPSLRVFSNSTLNFSQIFTDLISPELYVQIQNLAQEIEHWNIAVIQRDIQARMCQQTPSEPRAHQDTLEKCQSVISVHSGLDMLSSPSRIGSPHPSDIGFAEDEQNKQIEQEVKRLDTSVTSGFQRFEPIATEASKWRSSRTIEKVDKLFSPKAGVVPPIDLKAVSVTNNNDRRKDSLFSTAGSQVRNRENNFIQALAQEKDTTVFELTVYYANKFEALRRHYIGTMFEFVNSVAKSASWSENNGGKSGSEFFITHDRRFIFKKIPKQEMAMFLQMGMVYFRHMGKHFFHGMPSLLAKTLGLFKLVVKDSAQSKKQQKIYFALQENLFFQTQPENTIAYDLKGSEKRRYVKRAAEQSKKNVLNNQQESRKVLLDTNFHQDFNSEPIAISSATKIYIEAAVNNDSLMLSKVNVMDYSLLVIIDTEYKIIRAGIIDYARQYTFDKMLEHSVKFVVNAGQQPTITNPEVYRKRFNAAVDSYFVGMFAQNPCREDNQKAQQNIK